MAYFSEVSGRHPDVVLYGGTVFTGAADGTDAVTAVAVEGQTIAYAGSDAEALLLAGPDTKLVNLQGRFVCPGFHDSHNHMLSTGFGLLLPSLAQCRSIPNLLEVVRGQADTAVPGEWVVTASDWHESGLAERRMPSRSELDGIAPANPVIVRRGGHNVVLNSLALERFGITESSQAPDGASYLREAGKLTGQIVGSGYVAGLMNQLPKPGLDDFRAALDVVQQRYSAAGITSVIDPGLTLEEMDAYSAIYSESPQKVRVSMMWKLPTPGGTAAEAVDLLESGAVEAQRDDVWLRTLGVKLCVDGGVETGFYREPYERQDDPDYPCGKSFQSAAELEAICVAANRTGLPVGAHCVGDAGIDMALSAFEAAHSISPITDSRWTLIHMLYPQDDHWSRLNAMGVGVAAQEPLHFALGGGFAEYLGPDKAANIAPLSQYLARVDAPVGGGSDSPVAPFEPLRGISSSVTRRSRSAGILGPEWAVTTEEALSMYTSGSAWCASDEHRTGSIRAGMLADLVVLTADPRTVDPEDIGSIGVELTMAAGTVTHGSLSN
ncbi:amidohydrolase [Arthrobacter sp. 18067]|uniref:amidohydrolase n=1 Tax=Arthrobacter sp. 18067 TaxID=2681413 RepID=UPI00135B48CC|nr:amidohydrolase [Arthrobacter sp. 18067]